MVLHRLMDVVAAESRDYPVGVRLPGLQVRDCLPGLWMRVRQEMVSMGTLLLPLPPILSPPLLLPLPLLAASVRVLLGIRARSLGWLRER